MLPLTVHYDYHPSERELAQRVPIFMPEQPSDLERAVLSVSQPCAMILDGEEDLWEHMRTVYEVACCHYLLAEKHDPQFPDSRCSVSSRNVAFSLLAQGYPNAMVASTYQHDHSYVLLPFVLGEETGVILADPTSDQLWQQRQPKNYVAAFGPDWSYCTHWHEGADLFPDVFITAAEVRRFVESSKSFWKFLLNRDVWVPQRNGRKFLRKAWANPINIH